MGGQSDCFQPVEKLKGVTKKIVEICNEYNYPILFSTKTDTTYNVPVTLDLIKNETITFPFGYEEIVDGVYKVKIEVVKL